MRTSFCKPLENCGGAFLEQKRLTFTERIVRCSHSSSLHYKSLAQKWSRMPRHISLTGSAELLKNMLRRWDQTASSVLSSMNICFTGSEDCTDVCMLLPSTAIMITAWLLRLCYQAVLNDVPVNKWVWLRETRLLSWGVKGEQKHVV